VRKTMLLAVAVSCLLVAAAGPASAQTSGVRLQGDVPFAFVSGGRTLQAGPYSIEVRQVIVRILDANRHQVQSVLSNTNECNRKDEQPRLVFHRYGETYFLWQIWTRDYKVDFATSRTEYQLRARLKAAQDTVTLAMR
jgi:hypothetical protein